MKFPDVHTCPDRASGTDCRTITPENANWWACAASIGSMNRRVESSIGVTSCSFSKLILSAKFRKAGKARMLRQKIRLPDPALAHAETMAAAPISAALKTAALSLGAVVLLVVFSTGWSQFSKLQSGQIEMSAAERPGLIGSCGAGSNQLWAPCESQWP